MGIDVKLKEAGLLGTDQNQETQALLRCIIHELRDIKSILRSRTLQLRQKVRQQTFRMLHV
jgi:hypothetical protein